ncbi:ABC transporter permease [Aeromicrobium sp. NPDC092404]|uniref:ABC transporter permease n=1 Tax=Aeromicrobium sp. NPDC092404 TaxID=3154976 RepID=UPI003423BB67
MTGARTSKVSWHLASLVAQREFTSRVMTKAYAISTAVMVAILVGGQIVYAMASGDEDPTAIGTTGDDRALVVAIKQSAKALGHDVEIRAQGSESKARDRVKDGELDVAVIGHEDGSVDAVSQDELDSELESILQAAGKQVALEKALVAQDVDADRLAADVERASIDVDVLDPDDPDKGQRVALAYIAVLLLFFTVYLYGLYVAMGVVEEKSSRVVELLLSTIKPLELLVGKVIGIGAVGLMQVVVFGGAALATGLATDVVTIGSTAIAVFAASILWYVLGFAFFAVLYAALGSLVSRQEDVNNATMPLSILAFAIFFAAQASLSTPDSGWIETLSWIPPFSATLMPLRIAAGVTDPLQVVGTVIIMLVATAVTAVFAARIYESSVLNTGGRQSLRGALSRSR